MNPLNVHAGDTPAPTDPEDLAVVEHSARVIWRLFPYFAWRYAKRGRSFGRSDAGYLVTVAGLTEKQARAEIDWLVRLLVPRGMPSVLVEYQLESLGRLYQRRRSANADLFLSSASLMRRARLGVLDARVFDECEARCWSAARGEARRRGAGFLIAAAVADRSMGFGAHDDALVRWLTGACTGDVQWMAACHEAQKLALDALHPAPENTSLE